MAVEKSPEAKCLNNNSIETNDANQKHERIVDKLSAAEQAEQIGQKLDDLKKLCKDEIRKQHAIETIVRISIYMAQQYQNPNWHRFDILLIKHLRLLLELQKDHRTEFEKLFPLVSKIFWYFCEVDKIAHHFVNQLLDIWQQMLSNVDLKIKKSIFLTEKENFEKGVKFMKRIGCYAMQRKMLNVIIGYVDAKDKDKFILVSSLFHVIGANTHEIYKRLVHLHQAVAAGAGPVESRKRYIIQIVNEFGAGKVVSKSIHNVWFDGKMVSLFPEFEAWLDFNLGTKTVEFCFYYEGERKMARIDKYCVGLFKVENSDTEYSSVFEIEMINPMHYETMTNTTAHDVILLTTIRIELTYGILTERLESLLDDLLPNKYEFTVPPAKKKKASNGHSINDTEFFDTENGSEAIEEDDLLFVEKRPSQNVPKSQIAQEKLETKANIKKENKSDLADMSFFKVMNYNITTESVSNSQSAELPKDTTDTTIEPTDDHSEPIEQFEKTDEIPTAIDYYDEILKTTAIERKNSNSRDSGSPDETDVKSTEIVVKAMVHCDINGNCQSTNKCPKPNTKRRSKIGYKTKLKAIKPPNYNEITSIDFDQRNFYEKVANKITIEPNNNKENQPQNESFVIDEKVEPIVVESNNNKTKNQQKKIPVRKGRVSKPKPTLQKNDMETKVRRSSRTSSMKAQQKMSEQKYDIYEYDDGYDEFAVPEPPKRKRKTSQGDSSTKTETKAPFKRVPAKRLIDEEPKVKKPRKLYNPIESIDSNEELQPKIIEKPLTLTSKFGPQLEDDQLTTASFESHDFKRLDRVINRVNKNLVKMVESTEAKKFEDLFETPCYERGQINEGATFSYRKYAMKSSYSRVRMSTDSAHESESKKSEAIQVEDE